MERLSPGHLRGEIFAFTTIRRDGIFPYGMAWVDVELLGGSTRRITVKLTDLDPNRMDPAGMEEQVHIGDRVEIITREWTRVTQDPADGKDHDRGLLVYGYAARLICEEGN